jgi:hypothetical protein
VRLQLAKNARSKFVNGAENRSRDAETKNFAKSLNEIKEILSRGLEFGDEDDEHGMPSLVRLQNPVLRRRHGNDNDL